MSDAFGKSLLVLACVCFIAPGVRSGEPAKKCGVKEFTLEKSPSRRVQVRAKRGFEFSDWAKMPATKVPEAMVEHVERLHEDRYCTRDAAAIVLDSDQWKAQKPPGRNVHPDHRVPMVRGRCWVRGSFDARGNWQPDYDAIKLDADRSFGGVKLVRGTRVHVYKESGKLRSAWLKNEVEVGNGISARRQMLTFNRRGELLTAPKLLRVQKLKLKGTPPPKFYPDGQLKYGKLADRPSSRGSSSRTSSRSTTTARCGPG